MDDMDEAGEGGRVLKSRERREREGDLEMDCNLVVERSR